jgi:hypothetical protein
MASESDLSFSLSLSVSLSVTLPSFLFVFLSICIFLALFLLLLQGWSGLETAARYAQKLALGHIQDDTFPAMYTMPLRFRGFVICHGTQRKI